YWKRKHGHPVQSRQCATDSWISDDREEIVSIGIAAQRRRKLLHLGGVDKAHPVSHFFDRPDFEPLALLHRRHGPRALAPPVAPSPRRGCAASLSSPLSPPP